MSDGFDFIGMRFGRLTVKERTLSSSAGKSRWLCHCDCGIEKIILAASLKSGRAKSCGCWRSEATSLNSTTHGKYGSRVLSIWKHIMRRCYDSRSPVFEHYGGRGIAVCERWHSFENFLLDMGEPPAGMSIDRIDNNRNYEPSNCKWSNNFEQANNKRNNRRHVIGGRELTLAEWCRVFNVNYGTVRSRLKKGMSIEMALTEKGKHTSNG